MQGHYSPGLLQRHNIVPVGHLAADGGRDEKGAIVPVETSISRIDHSQFARLAQVDCRKLASHGLQERGDAGPNRYQAQQRHADHR